MIDAIYGFFAGVATAYLLTWPGFIVLFLFGTYLEHVGARRFAVIVGVITLLVAYFFFGVSVGDLLVYTGIYASVGFLWSFWRYNRFVRSEVEKIDEYRLPDAKLRALNVLRPMENISRITAWVVIWPFSALENLAGDLINIIQTFIKKVFRKVYESLFTQATQNLYNAINRQKAEDKEKLDAANAVCNAKA